MIEDRTIGLHQPDVRRDHDAAKQPPEIVALQIDVCGRQHVRQAVQRHAARLEFADERDGFRNRCERFHGRRQERLHLVDRSPGSLAEAAGRFVLAERSAVQLQPIRMLKDLAPDRPAEPRVRIERVQDSIRIPIEQHAAQIEDDRTDGDAHAVGGVAVSTG